jgi:hypothetical protein
VARSYGGLADVFAVWVPEIARCYVVPVSECGSSAFAMRLSPARNNQRKKTRMAADYELRPRLGPPAQVRERGATYRAARIDYAPRALPRDA